MRITELLEVENVNVHLDERYLIGGKKTDAGKNRVIPINKKILPFIKARYNPENKYLINFEGKPVTYTTYIRNFFTYWEHGFKPIYNIYKENLATDNASAGNGLYTA